MAIGNDDPTGAERPAAGGAGAGSGAGAAGDGGGAGSGSGSGSGGLSAREDRELQKELNAVERRMTKTAAAVDTVTAEMAEVAQAAEGVDTARLAELDARLKDLRSEHDELETRWLEIAERKESARG